MAFLNYLQSQSQRRIIILSSALILLIASIDYLTGVELSFSIFYLIPIIMIAWLVNDQRIAILVAFISSVIWLVVEKLGGQEYSSQLIPFWNAGVRLGFFLIVIASLSSLRAATVRREELIQFIVHDLRSPLSNIQSGLSYLLDISNDTLAEDQLTLVKLSVTSSNRMMSLVNSLLDLGKLESGYFKPNLQSTDVGELFNSALEQVSAMAIRRDVSLVSEVDSGAENVRADSELLIRVLVNIISNALKYSPPNATVQVRAVVHSNTQIAIHIHDQGTGIPKEWINKVFVKYTQVGARKQGMPTGSGLGLTFCRLAIEAQHGQIWLESDLGQGTTVKFTLPQK